MSNTPDTLIPLLQSELNLLPEEIQGYANNFIASAAHNGSTMFARSEVLLYLDVNVFSINFTNSWPFAFVSDQAKAFINYDIPSNFGYVCADSLTNVTQFTTNITVYLDRGLLMIFFFNDAAVQLGTFIAPGIIIQSTEAVWQTNIMGSWSQTGEDSDGKD